MQKKKSGEEKEIVSRPPVVAVLGHIDHGKSTLLDYMRKSRVKSDEIGGITQHIAAYEVTHVDKGGKKARITFIDTPGHEAFGSIRSRGAHVADIVILIVSAEDGVKAQTLEALETIRKSKTPYIVAINKIDKPDANIEKTLSELSEQQVYFEGRGGDIPYVAISAKTGEGIDTLFETLLLLAEVEELKGDKKKNAEGVVIEAHLDEKKGISGTLIIKDGTLKKGMGIAAGESTAPVRIMEDASTLNTLDEASFSSPVCILGWSTLPTVGSTFQSFTSKKEAEQSSADHIRNTEQTNAPIESQDEISDETVIIPLVIKGDAAGTIDAIRHELEKLMNEHIVFKIIHTGVGTVSENDIKIAGGDSKTIVLAFNTKIESGAGAFAERLGITVVAFDIIYKLTEWLQKAVLDRMPKVETTKREGEATILKAFSQTKDKQVLGGRVEDGVLIKGRTVNIMRRSALIGTGHILELQQQKKSVEKVASDGEFGIKIESKTIMAPGDVIESLVTVRE